MILNVKSATSKNSSILGVIVLIVIVLVSVSVIGASHFMGMQIRENGTMSGCLFDGKAEICTMTFMQHLSAWQSILTTLSPKVNLMSILLSAIVLLGVVVILRMRNRLLVDSAELSISRQRLYIKQNSYISPFNPLREAFSQGILNPKIYASTAVL